MSERVLLLDAGNTRLKWAVVDCGRIKADTAGLSKSEAWLSQGAATYDALGDLTKQWRQYGDLTACYGVSVAGEAARSRVEELINELALGVQRLHASASACGVLNTYQPPQSLGADRWAALIAVRQRTTANALVVSAGTALTIDALDARGHFVGGMILPGLHGMRYALAHTTAQLGIQHGRFQEFPNTTADAVESGVISACSGAIASMYARLEKKSATSPRIFLTGGDATILRSHLPADTTEVPALVLEGVYWLAREAHAQ